MKKLNYFLLTGSIALFTSCGGGETDNSTNKSETEAPAIKESVYSGPETKIGDQVWMAENLNVEVFKNGEPIPQAQTATEWNDAANNKTPAWCYYDGDPANGKKYGKLYNWYAVSDSRGLAPKGWHVASHGEWITLSETLGDNVLRKLKNTAGWESDYGNANGDNSFGFNALPAGFRRIHGPFKSLKSGGYFWTSTEYSVSKAHLRHLGTGGISEDIDRFEYPKSHGMSVRCIKD